MNDDDTAVEEIAEAWDAFMHAMRRARGRSAARLDGGGLSLSQYLLVVPLLDEAPLPTGELAARALVSAPSATRMIDGLERDGLVRRAASPDDRRVVLVSLTGEGARVVREKRELIRARRRELVRTLAPAERAEAARILQRMATLVDEF